MTDAASLGDVLYHYTSFSSLLSMLSTKQLWLTEYRFLNDRREHTFASDMYKAFFAQPSIEHWTSQLTARPELLNVFKNNVSRLATRYLGPLFHDLEGYLTYVFSLSTEGDSLAQWRAYGNGEVCIGFKYQLFRDLVENNQIAVNRIERVEYFGDGPPSTPPRELREIFNDFIDRVLIQNQHSTEMTLSRRHILDSLLVKHIAFETEHEVRFVAARYVPSFDPDLTVRSRGRSLVHCWKLAFEPRAAIAEIKFGPGADPELAEQFKAIWKRYPWSFVPGCKISSSEAPFRP